MEFAEFIKIPMVDKVTLIRPGFSRIDGTLCVTGHHLMFSSRMQDSEELMVSILYFVGKKNGLLQTWLIYHVNLEKKLELKNLE